MIILDLPTPPSVNRTRIVNWAVQPRVKQWKKAADMSVLVWRSRQRAAGQLVRHIEGPFEIHVTIGGRMDLDNGLKPLIDYLRTIEVIEGDSPDYMRKLTVEWRDIEGCRVIIKPVVP